MNFIGSKRATDFLKWLYSSGLYIHYSALNNLFYSLVDIVDSLWETHPQCIMYIWEIKSALYDFVIEHQDEVIDILIRHTYGIDKKKAIKCIPDIENYEYVPVNNSMLAKAEIPFLIFERNRGKCFIEMY